MYEVNRSELSQPRMSLACFKTWSLDCGRYGILFEMVISKTTFIPPLKSTLTLIMSHKQYYVTHTNFLWNCACSTHLFVIICIAVVIKRAISVKEGKIISKVPCGNNNLNFVEGSSDRDPARFSVGEALCSGPPPLQRLSRPNPVPPHAYLPYKQLPLLGALVLDARAHLARPPSSAAHAAHATHAHAAHPAAHPATHAAAHAHHAAHHVHHVVVHGALQVGRATSVVHDTHTHTCGTRAKVVTHTYFLNPLPESPEGPCSPYPGLACSCTPSPPGTPVPRSLLTKTRPGMFLYSKP